RRSYGPKPCKFHQKLAKQAPEGIRREKNSMIWNSLRSAWKFAVAVLTAVIALCTQTNAGSTLAYWNFDSVSGAPASLSADSGTGTLYLTPDHTGTAGTGIKAPTGTATATTVNTPIPNFYGFNAITFPNGTGNVGNGEYFEVGLPLNGTQSN